MAKPDLEIVRVMGRGNFYHTGSKIRFDIGVRNNGDFSSHNGEGDGFADQILIPLVIGMHRNSSVAQHGFRACCRQLDETASVRQRIF